MAILEPSIVPEATPKADAGEGVEADLAGRETALGSFGINVSEAIENTTTPTPIEVIWTPHPHFVVWFDRSGG